MIRARRVVNRSTRGGVGRSAPVLAATFGARRSTSASQAGITSLMGVMGRLGVFSVFERRRRDRHHSRNTAGHKTSADQTAGTEQKSSTDRTKSTDQDSSTDQTKDAGQDATGTQSGRRQFGVSGRRRLPTFASIASPRRRLSDRLDNASARLRSVASRLEHSFPCFAAAITQRATSVQLIADWFAEETIPNAEMYHRLRVFGGREHPVRIPEQVADDVATELRDIARVLRAERRRIVSGHLRRVLPPAPAAIAGPGSLGDVAWWCDDTADSLVPSLAARRVHANSFVTGVGAGFVTPTAGWLALWWGTRVVGAVVAHPVTWVCCGAAWSGRGVLQRKVALWGGWLGMSAPARFPVATDLVMRHTLAWWQGFSRGWNMAHQPWVWLKGRGVPLPKVPLMPSLSSTAELNAMLVTVGARWNRLVDDVEVVVESPVDASAGRRQLDLGSLVAMSDEIMAHADRHGDRHGDPLDDLPCAVRVAVLPGLPRRMVIILPGTQTFSMKPVRNPYAMSQNIHLLANGSASNSRAVQNVVWQARRRAGWSDSDAVSILVFGHSQGGIIAAELARQMVFSTVNHVSHVVTTGAPIAGRPFPAATSFLAVEHLEDVIPKLDLTDNPAQPNVVTVKAPALAREEQGRVLDVHRWLVYERTLRRVAASEHPTLRLVNAQLAPFFEEFVSLEDYPQHRPLPS